MILSRRSFLARVTFVAIPVALVRDTTPNTALAQAKRRPDSMAADTLADPMGRASAPLGPLDNDPGVIAIERRLRCTCGCTLDVYTCRTTDFSCTYSPAMHQDVVARTQQGEPPDQIIQAFVARYGDTVLMAPPPHGFNLAGYLLPGLTVTAVALGLVAWLMRRRASPGAGGVALAPAPGLPVPPPDAEQLQRLQRALDDIES